MFDALQEVAELLGDSLNACNEVLDTAQDPVAKIKARGADEALERIVSDVERRIETVKLNRVTVWSRCTGSGSP